jgi:Zn ribbon nucleic-acid-binding protein
MPELAEVFRLYGSDYLAQFGERLLPGHRRALVDITACRTARLGGQMTECRRCGHHHPVYHSCRHRSCPKCHATDTARWLEKRENELLPVSYAHAVFTLPEELRRLVRRHQKTLYGVLMKAAAEALMELAADPHYVGGQIGFLAVLHTWGAAMVFHPHVHCLIPAGGLTEDGQWRTARKRYLVPVQALSLIFRAKFMALARKAHPELSFPQSLWDKDWVVYCKPAPQGGKKVLRYLGRYGGTGRILEVSKDLRGVRSTVRPGKVA